jgi:hypothetical protein
LKNRQLPLATWLLVDDADAADDATAETTLPLRDDCSGDSAADTDGAVKDNDSTAAVATTAAFSSDLSVFSRTETPFVSARLDTERRSGAVEAFLSDAACLVGVGWLKTLLLLLLLSASGVGCCFAFGAKRDDCNCFDFAAEEDNDADFSGRGARATGETAAGAVTGRLAADDDSDADAAADAAADDIIGCNNELPSPL